VEGAAGPSVEAVSGGFLFAAAFLASAVEMVEALTIVLAVGVTRDWRSALTGVGVAAIALIAVVAALGPALTLLPRGCRSGRAGPAGRSGALPCRRQLRGQSGRRSAVEQARIPA
jgi:hypothetical protein